MILMICSNKLKKKKKNVCSIFSILFDKSKSNSFIHFFFILFKLNLKKVCRTCHMWVDAPIKLTKCYIWYTVKFCSLYNTKRIYWWTLEIKANRIDGVHVIFWTCSNGIYWLSINPYQRVQHQCCQMSYPFKYYIRLQYNKYIFKLPSSFLQF